MEFLDFGDRFTDFTETRDVKQPIAFIDQRQMSPPNDYATVVPLIFSGATETDVLTIPCLVYACDGASPSFQ